MLEYEDEALHDYKDSYNYYIYYHSIKPRDHRLPKPLYTPAPDLESLKNKNDNEKLLDESSLIKHESNDRERNLVSNVNNLISQMRLEEEGPEKTENFNNRPIHPEYIQNFDTAFNNFENFDKNVNISPEMYFNYNNSNFIKNIYNYSYQSIITPSPGSEFIGNRVNMNHDAYYYSQDPNFGYKKFNQPFEDYGVKNNFYSSYREKPNYKNNNMNNNFNNIAIQPDLKDLLENSSDFCKDHSGSRLVQKRFEDGSEEEKDEILAFLLPNFINLAKDVFGNYVIQKILEHSRGTKRKDFIMQMRGNINSLALHMYGCRVVQKSLEIVDQQDAVLIFTEIKHSVPQFIEDQNGNHVIQKLIERLPREYLREILEIFTKKSIRYAKHQYGCRVSYTENI